MTKQERKEDLNPHTEEVEEKVRQLMDPAVPDTEVSENKSFKKSSKIKQVSVIEPIDSVPETQTAPELEQGTPLPTKGRKIIVPVHHDKSEDTKEELPAPEPEPEERPTLKIDVNDESETPEEVAEKLDEAIAGLAETEEETTKEADTSSDVPTVLLPEEPEEPDEEAENLPKPAVVEEPETDKAVKEIVAKESDELLEVEDAIKESDEGTAKEASKHHFSLKNFITSKKTRKVFLAILLIGFGALGAYPATRYSALSMAGVRSSSTVTVLDSSTQQPLKNVTISMGEVTSKTDNNGLAHLEKLKLGKTKLKIERIAFETLEKTITVGWGSNQLGSVSINPIGAQYKLQLNDYLSGKGLENAEAESSEASARGDANGLITLTIPQTDASEITVRVTAQNYRTESIVINLSNKETAKIKLVAGRKHVFVSKRSGKYDIYSAFVDGKEEKLVLAGSGNEKDDLTLLPHSTKNLVAYVSTRAGKKNADGFVLSDLVVLDPSNGRTTPVLASERIQLLGWVDDRLIFVAIASGQSAATANRNRLLSYNLTDAKTTELAISNYFNDLLIARGVVYFAPSSAIAGGTPAQFFSVNPDGSNQKSLYAGEVWNILRNSYDNMALSVGQQWFDYKLGEANAKKLDSAPASKIGRVYIDSPDGKKSAWVDQRDGKGTLIIYNVGSKTEATLTARSGLSLPITWLDDKTLVFRVESKDEVADYAVSVDGGEPVKIKDVTKTAGIDNWYYY